MGSRLKTVPLTSPPQRSLLVYIQAVLPSLNQTEKLIAGGILKDPERVLYSSISEMGKVCGASVGSIVKFCRSVGCKGFTDFKIALAQDLAQSGFSVSRDADAEGAPESLLEQVFDFHGQSLKETLQINSSRILKQTSQALEKANRIEFFSIGMSYPVAYTAFCRFKLIGLPVNAEHDAHMQLVAASQLKKGDVGFGISCSGSTKETVECLQIARERKATTVCLTNSVRSPITQCADLALYATPSEIKYFQAPLASRVTQIALIDALFVSVALRHKDESMTRLRRSGEKLLRHRLA